MTVLAAFLVVGQAAPVQEVVEPEVAEITIQAVVKLPPLSQEDLRTLQVVVRAIPKQTEDFVSSQMSAITFGGLMPKADLMPDHVRIQIWAVPGALKNATLLMESLLRRAALSQEALNESVAELGKRRSSYLRAVLWPALPEPRIIPRARAVDIYKRVFRPDRVFVAVGGELKPGAAVSEWQERLSNWQVPKDRTSAKHEESADVPMTHAFHFQGPQFPAGDVALSTRLLALIALGSGKDSSLFRVVRQQLRLSYAQDAVLWPTPTGWSPRLIIHSSKGSEAEKRSAREALVLDVKSWDQATRSRALGMAEAVLLRGLEFSPLYLSPGHPVGDSLADRTFMAAYWPMKTGRSWDPQRLLATMRSVSLEDLQMTALEILGQN